jgi:hypothetical protein
MGVGALSALLAATACVTQQQFLDQHQPMAIQTAVGRGQFELNCPSATGVVISREVVQPRLEGTGPYLGGVQGVQRAEYTIGVEGCGERKTFVVLCPEGSGGCFAAGPGPFHQY